MFNSIFPMIIPFTLFLIVVVFWNSSSRSLSSLSSSNFRSTSSTSSSRHNSQSLIKHCSYISQTSIISNVSTNQYLSKTSSTWLQSCLLLLQTHGWHFQIEMISAHIRSFASSMGPFTQNTKSTSIKSKQWI